jgi:type II secretory pathway pseudopilin PulG
VAGMNLQGGQAGIAGGQALGQLGTQCLAAQMNVLNTQSQAGAQQQQNQQQVINNAINNYAVAQQYPQQQLAFMNAQLRGLPLQSSTVQQYNAPPSGVSQAAGLGTAGIAGLGLYNAMSGNTSDIRAKENIEAVGWLPNGLPVYEFEYKAEFKDKAGHGRYRGVMAHDVEEIMPQAVNVDSNGYKLVSYPMLGIKMEQV